jgi:hypothetical protein
MINLEIFIIENNSTFGAEQYLYNNEDSFKVKMYNSAGKLKPIE